MLRLALISYHSCPTARLGEKDAGGMNVYVRELARELGALGCRVDAFTRRRAADTPKIVRIGEHARVIHIDAGPLDADKSELYRHIPEFINGIEAFRRGEGVSYDLTHSHYWLSGRVGVDLRRRWRAPHIATFHTLARVKQRARPGEYEPPQRAAIEEMIMDKADAVVVSTLEEKDDIAKLYKAPVGKVRVIPPGVDTSLFQPTDKRAARQSLGMTDDRVILYVGRVEPIKGIDILLGAMGMLDEKRGTRLVIVGGSLDAPEIRRFQATASELGVADMVSFAGSVPQERLISYYNAADVFVMPAYHESFGLAALEAMACGAPVVASRVGGLKTFVDHGKTGYLIPWRCAEPFAQHMDTLLANPALRDSMGAAARRKAQSMSWSGMANRMLNCYSTAMGLSLENIAGG